ncbi:type I methionyl aminopeptidase [Candidatus Hepatobacter penaei]|uniref:type I methionyl aminopeptidase n=1 Tax=Candidatus Hepatobacter penaei TaxID=1274402 RepID=UPI0009E23ED0|nr:type I methionyl aminopeptidase [Candidatus Hepatobacter penaei]TGW14938.1 type I methionyl aminopeptidase [bacterium NHP-B]
MNVCCKLEAPHVHSPEGPILLHDASAFEKMRKAGALAASILDRITPFVKAGTTTGELDRLCDDMIRASDAIPAPLHYKGYPKSICTSLNHVVCHGIPGEACLKNGDILNIDVTVILDGWYGDTSRMFVVGHVPPHTQKLIDVTKQALHEAIHLVRPGCYLGDIGHHIQTLAQQHGFSVVRDYCGHGIGQFFHGPPSVLHVGEPGTGVKLEPGMMFTIEPMLNMGKPGTKLLSDGWTVVTKDKSLSAQFEHTLGVTQDGCEIFTQSV